MSEKIAEKIVRKFPLPLRITVGDDTVVTDGFFTLTSKQASAINITSIGQDGYITCEIVPPTKKTIEKIVSPEEFFAADYLIGIETSRARGRGKDFGQYRYYKRPDGSLYAVVNGGKRSRKYQLGKPTERDSPISIVGRAIVYNFNTSEFSKKELTQMIPKHLSYGQKLKALLDIMTIEGYLEKRQTKPRGRFQELFKATDKLRKLLTLQPRTSLESMRPVA